MVDKADNDSPALYSPSGGALPSKSSGNGVAFNGYAKNGSAAYNGSSNGSGKVWDGAVKVDATPEYFHDVGKSARVGAPRWRPTYNGAPIVGETSKKVGRGDTPRYLHGLDLDKIETTGWRATLLGYKLQALTYGILFFGLTGHFLYYLYTLWWWYLYFPFTYRLLGWNQQWAHKYVNWQEPHQGNGTPHDPYKVVIIGSGYSGLGMGIKLKREKFNNFMILERGDGVAGTWRENKFPGLACDVPSNLYSFSFQPWPYWTRMWPLSDEIQQYIEWCAQHFGITPQHIKYKFYVSGATWHEDKQLWEVKCKDGTQPSVWGNSLVNGQGFLSDPRVPDIPGLKSFKGPIFHSQKWRHDIDLRNKRVAVLGCGASGIQIVPELQKITKKLYHFQRSAWWVVPRFGGENFVISEKWKARFRRYPFVQQFVRCLLYWLGEGLYPAFTSTRIFNRLKAEESIQQIYQVTDDPELRRKLIPKFEFGCRRMLLSSEFYRALTKPNVEVIQSGVSRMTERSVVDDEGNEYEVDAVILATGFYTQKQESNADVLLDIVGRDGVRLRDVWGHTQEAYKGTTIPGFPNYFVLLGPNTNVAAISVTYMGESQHTYILDFLQQQKAYKYTSVEPKKEAFSRWNEWIQREISKMVWQTGGCYSWYLDSRTGKNTIMWPKWNFQYTWAVERFDAEHYNVKKAPGAKK